jgi:MFS family permease
MRKLDRSLERILQPFYSPPLAPIAATEDNSEEEEEGEKSLSPQEQIEILEESLPEQHWLLNGRFLLFCFSNFALCLVMGVPYVIIPRYISETFDHQGFLASWTLSNVGIASAIGQILLGYLHDRKIFSAWLMYTFAVIISGVSLVILALFRYKTIVLICAFLYGLAISANYALQLLIIIDALSMDKMTNAFGIFQFCQGVSTLIGIPIQGIPVFFF